MKRFLQNLSANGVGILINLAAQLFSIPLFLHTWSKELYGEWLVMTAVPNLLWSLEGGLGVLAQSRMTLAAAVHDWRTANEIFQTTLLSQILISLALWGATLGVALNVNLSAYFGFHKLSPADASFILVVMITYMILGLMISVYRAAYRASDLEARGVYLFNFWRGTDICIVVTVLALHGTPVRLAECLLCGMITWIVLGYFDVRRKCGEVHFGLHLISWHRLAEMVIHGLPVLGGQMATAVYMQGYPLVINRALGPAAVVTFSTVRTFCRLGLLPMQTVAFACASQLSRSYAAKDAQLFSRLLKIMAVTVFWISIGLMFGLSTVGPWLIGTWTVGKVSIDHFTLALFTLTVAFQGVWCCMNVVLNACNKQHLFNYSYLGMMFVSLGVASVLTRRLGFEVIPFIMLAADLTLTALGFYLCRKKVPFFHPSDIVCVVQASFYRSLFAKAKVQKEKLAAKAKLRKVEA